MKYTVRPSPGPQRYRFGFVEDGALVISPQVEKLATEHGLSDAEEILSWAMTFPDETAQLLGWPRGDVGKAVADLGDLLRVTNSTRQVQFGVLPPPDIDFGKTTAQDLATRRKK